MKIILDIGILSVNILVMLTVGMELERRHFRQVAARKWVLAVTIATQVLFLPLLGIAVTSVMSLFSHLTAGVLLLAAIAAIRVWPKGALMLT